MNAGLEKYWDGYRMAKHWDICFGFDATQDFLELWGDGWSYQYYNGFKDYVRKRCRKLSERGL